MKEPHNNTAGPPTRNNKKRSQRIIHIGLFVFSILAGLTAATQYFAYMFDYQDALGISLFHFYAPWKILIWSAEYILDFPWAIRRAESLGLVITTLCLLACFARKSALANALTVNKSLHGSARWANKKDIGAAGLLNEAGVYVGAWKDKNEIHYLRHNGPEHVLCYAPTRSGKDVGLVIPTLLSWEHSAVVLDLKGELWELTAGWRQQHARNKVLRFEPASTFGSIGFNPFEEIRLSTEHEVGDVQNLAMLIVDPDGRGLNDHWQKTSQSLLVGAILHLLYKCRAEGEIANFAMLDAMLANPAEPVSELWKAMANNQHLNGISHQVVAAAGCDMIDRPEEEAGSVLSTAKSYLSLYRDPIIAKNTGKSGFRIRDLMNYDDPISLYIITQPSDKTRLRPLVRVLVNMIFRLLAERMEFENGRHKPHYKHRLLMMMNEFVSFLGKLEIAQESLAFIAGWGIKCYIITQDYNQLQDPEIGYGRQESITSNCHIQIAFAPNRLETAEHLSKLTGVTTVIKDQITTSGNGMSILKGQVSRTLHEVQRPLLTPDEIMRMPGPQKDKNGLIVKPGDMLVYCAGFPAIYGQQPLYFQEPIFQKRSEIPAPKETDTLNNFSIHKYKIAA